jgi:hypothetical protein
MATKYTDKNLKYYPIGSGGNGKKNRYEVGINPDDYYTEEELEFLKAMDRYKNDNDKPFPALTEVLSVLKALGYRKEQTPCDGPRNTWARNRQTDLSCLSTPIAACAPPPKTVHPTFQWVNLSA